MQAGGAVVPRETLMQRLWEIGQLSWMKTR